MARTKLSDEQKEMIRMLSLKEKDKLLLRLIAKDDVLLEQLTYTHLEMGETLEERRQDVVVFFQNVLSKQARPTRPDTLLKKLRTASGRLGKHVRVTKDKLGEVSLLVDLLNFALDEHLEAMRRRYVSPYDWYRLAHYIAKRFGPLFKKANKLHPDLWMEFEPKLNDLLMVLHDCPELNLAMEEHQVPKQWNGF